MATRCRLLAGLALGIVLAGCATAAKPYALVEPRPRSIAEFYTVEPGLAWTATTGGANVELWTIDGYVLEALTFFNGVGDGQPLIARAQDDDKHPRFRAAMTLTETAEFVATSLFRGRVTPRSVRPAPFGGAPGFRFDLEYWTGDGVHRKGLVAGAVVKDRLHVIVYDGVALHHFGKYLAEAERVIDSVRFK